MWRLECVLKNFKQACTMSVLASSGLLGNQEFEVALPTTSFSEAAPLRCVSPGLPESCMFPGTQGFRKLRPRPKYLSSSELSFSYIDQVARLNFVRCATRTITKFVRSTCVYWWQTFGEQVSATRALQLG